MSNPYPMLTYPGDVTSSAMAQPGQMLGWDELMRPYEVIEAMVYHKANADDCTCDQGEEGFQNCPWHNPGCDVCGREDVHSHVLLQYAQPETVREQGQAYMADAFRRGLIRL